MLSKREEDRLQALKELEKKFVEDQLADLLYLQRSRSSAPIGNGLLDVLFSLGEAVYAATAPSREQIREKIENGLLDDAVARKRFKELFNNFLNDLSNEEKDRLISSRTPITQVIQYYVARNSQIALSDSIMTRYQEEEKTADGQDRFVVLQNISAAQGIRQATIDLPKILPTDEQLRNYNAIVNPHRAILENNRSSDAKMFAAIAIGGLLVPFLAPFVALAAVAMVMKPSLAQKTADAVTNTRFFTDTKASTLSAESTQLVKLGRRGPGSG